MNCPYCGKPMERGNIPVYDRAIDGYWLPAEEERLWLYTRKGVLKKNGVILTETSILEMPRMEAYICRDCKKGVFQIPE